MNAPLKGKAEMQRRLERMGERMPNQVERALYLEAELIMTDSKQRYVPVDLGTLRSSGHVQRPVRNGREISVSMVYGGPAAAYALAIHEHPSDASPPSWRGKPTLDFSVPGTGTKYLERPMNAALNGMAERIARRIDIDGLVR